MAKVREISKGIWAVYCPACDMNHHIWTDGDVKWSFNNDTNNPTFSPSIRVSGYNDKEQKLYVCHFHIINGTIQYCSDCTHELKDTTKELIEIK